ncbi:transcription factor [Grosmannia clavigera kw1407]|uniref:Transcription factor n=1 Tax=Grosmannia clavigera (strain kw1407 / UAMH 11150) TaxID=655863 RepID=F0XC62_GROCL|nr:transcription factor [Grosmannia clavigera kw1407]EFX04020.1 transcription factor [Grosmannia clavigera kw1407]
MAEPASMSVAPVATSGVSYASYAAAGGQGPPTPRWPPTPGLPPMPSSPRSFVAVGLNEAALDSPSFRANTVNFNEQMDLIEKWLENHVKSTSRLVHDFLGFEESINRHLAQLTPPPGVADGIIDADHTLLALKRVGDGSRDWWTKVVSAVRRLDNINAEPVRNFLNGELRAFKESRRALDQAQKTFDATLARYVSQAKTKEPSALREDAFSVYETRRNYLKASMDYCLTAPQLRCSLDKLLTRVSADFWREMKRARDTNSSSLMWGDEMDRIRGWSKELELSEASLRRELQMTRREIGDTAMASTKPSRELDDYSSSTVPFLGSRGPVSVRPTKESQTAKISENQGWLFTRTISGKPARVSWVRRWYYCRDGIFGYLVQGPHGVLQGDDIGVLLCSAKPAVQEERRFCFEVKTKSLNMLLQAETQGQLTEWLEVFDVAKKKAFETSMTRDSSPQAPGSIDPAFSIAPPPVSEFSARVLDGAPNPEDSSTSVTFDRSGALPVPGLASDGLASRSSFDLSVVLPRRSITVLGQELKREEGESSREHAARIIQKLDLHRKATFGSGSGVEKSTGESASNGGSTSGSRSTGSNAPPQAGANGGIASLISASHNAFPANPSSNVAPMPSPTVPTIVAPHLPQQPVLLVGDSHHTALAPTTNVKSPMVTFLSKIAVTASSERVLNRFGTSAGLPAGILANYWGSNLWGSGFVSNGTDATHSSSALDAIIESEDGHGSAGGGPGTPTTTSMPSGHRKTLSVEVAKMSDPRVVDRPAAEVFPAGYPSELRGQHAQFRLLFPTVPLHEKLVLVFNAAWSSASEEGATNQGLIGSGRVYVTSDNMYFYSQTMGLVVAYSVSLDIISEVTAAPGKDCDYIFLHLGSDTNETGFTRITIKTFLEDMYLLQARLNLLIDDLQAAEPMELSDIVTSLYNLDSEELAVKSPSVGSWEEVSAMTPIDDGTSTGRAVSHRHQHGPGSRQLTSAMNRAFPRPSAKVQLPSQPVIYEPEGMSRKVAERHFEISAKACFHVLFGDKSFIFAKLYLTRRAHDITQGPWTLVDKGGMRRKFQFKMEAETILGRARVADVTDEQQIEVFSDHVTYVVTHIRTAWHMPSSQAFKVVVMVVITHVAKSKCKLAVYTRVDWNKALKFSRMLIERQVLDEAGRDAEELAELATDEVRKLGAHSRTKRAIQVYGSIGQQTQAVLFTPGKGETLKRPLVKPRTLTGMVLETSGSFMESVASSLVMWSFAVLRKLFHVATAHRLILAVLALSLMTNALFSARETTAWWTERHAAQFMTRIGVGPNTMMSRAVYVVDLEEASQGMAKGQASHRPENSMCYDTFRAIANTTDLDAPSEEAGTLLGSTTSRATAQRLRRGRQKLGSYRHDLLVAMRVVNSVEREMVQAEWETWLADENMRCDRARLMLEAKRGEVERTEKAEKIGKKGKTGKTGKTKEVASTTARATARPGPADEKQMVMLTERYERYCGSCHADLSELEQASWRQSMV